MLFGDSLTIQLLMLEGIVGEGEVEHFIAERSGPPEGSHTCTLILTALPLGRVSQPSLLVKEPLVDWSGEPNISNCSAPKVECGVIFTAFGDKGTLEEEREGGLL